MYRPKRAVLYYSLVSAPQILTPLFTELPKNAFATRRYTICAPSQRTMNASSFAYTTLLINESAKQRATRNEKARFLRGYPFTSVPSSFFFFSPSRTPFLLFMQRD